MEKPPAVDAELKRRIRELIAYKGGGTHPDIVADVIENALRMLTDVTDRGDARVIQSAVRELRRAFRAFGPYSQTRKVTIFGSARTQPSQPEYQQAVEFGRKIAAAGFMVITGAGPGIMHAGHEGAGLEKSIGANIQLPWEQAPNPIIQNDSKLVTFKYFFARKLVFVRYADALVLFPGGLGTLDEGYEALTLMQTGKSKIMPLILVDRPGGTFWKTWDKHVREQLLHDKLISPEDLFFYQYTDDTDQAVAWIQQFYRNYHSSRFVKKQLILRVQKPPALSVLESLNKDFADIIEGEPMHAITATPEEELDHDFPNLPRIAFGFDRRNYGRLRQLINALNEY